jgi:hypothetical protein
VVLVSVDNDAAAVAVPISAAGHAGTNARLDIAHVTSAVLEPSGRAIWLVGTAPNGTEPALWSVPIAGGRPGHAAQVAPLRAGDRLLDVLHAGTATQVLLARPDPLGDEVAHALARLEVPDRGHIMSGDPFADPLGYGRGPAWWIAAGAHTGLVYADGVSLRAADFDHGMLRNLRGVAAMFPHGGALLDSAPIRAAAAAHPGAARWVALATGDLPDDAPRVSATTVVAVNAAGELLAVSHALPNDPTAIPGHAAVAADAEGVTVVYPHTDAHGGMNWMVSRGRCTLHPATVTNAAAANSSRAPGGR